MTTIAEKFFRIHTTEGSKDWYEERNWWYYKEKLQEEYQGVNLDDVNCNQAVSFGSVTPNAGQNVSQPVWSLYETNDYVKSEKFEKYESEGPGPVKDGIAWYQPAHFHYGEYGIYITKNDLLCLAKKLKEDGALNNIADDMDYVSLAFLILFYHETGHFWLEELCNLYRLHVDQNIYENAHNRYGSYILMEEAICNSFSLGWLKYVLQFHENMDHTIEIVKQYMDNQGRGYKDYFEADWLPECTYDIQFHLKKLLVKVYEADPVIAQHVITSYVGPIEFANNQELPFSIENALEGIPKELFIDHRYCPLKFVKI